MRYFLQSFSMKNGRLEEGFGQFVEAHDQALLAAERIARTRAGVVVMAQPCNLFGEPEGQMRPIASFGHVPGISGAQSRLTARAA